MLIKEVFQNFKGNQNPEINNPYIIAEAGVNHEGSLDTAKLLIKHAKESGADAIKFQSYKANLLASKDSPAYWDTSLEKTESQYKLFSKHDKFWKNEMEFLKEYCDKCDIEFMCTPFDHESVEFLAPLMNCFKISSSDINNKPLLELIASFKKPIILSTGASFIYEIFEALSWIEPFGVPVALLHCVLNYPTKDENANLSKILTLRSRFPNNIIGYSDHTLPKNMESLEMATLLGARILEKHFTHNKSLEGNDHYHSMDKNDLSNFKNNLNNIFEKLGKGNQDYMKSQDVARLNARRSCVSKKFIKKGEKLHQDSLICKRPAFGIEPKYLDKIIGKTAIVDIPEDTIINWNMIN